MALYLRYTNNIESDIERSASYNYTGLDKDMSIEEVAEACGIDANEIEYNEDSKQYVQVLPGLCAFELESDNLEDAIEEAEEFDGRGDYSTSVMRRQGVGYSILEGKYVGDCAEGDCISVTNILYTNK